MEFRSAFCNRKSSQKFALVVNAFFFSFILAANSVTHASKSTKVQDSCFDQCLNTCESNLKDDLTTFGADLFKEDLTTAQSENLEVFTLPAGCIGQDGSGSGEGSGEEEPCPPHLTFVLDCTNSTYGCCPDNRTAAIGEDFAGCPNLTVSIECANTEHGCCPDGQTPATGPRYFGCTCEHYPAGCCQDRYTPARGPNFDGCVCTRMLYGCCNDGVTPATGPNFEGCSCDSSTFGCCPDMISIAKGPENEGCPCDSLQYGCCPNSTIPARGPNFEGCNCANTPFGCCPDGIHVAYGPKFEACPSGPSLDTKLVTEVCGLPKERGVCRNYTVKWYFDLEYGGCNRFWYGGCEGNGNRFSSQEQCERACVSPEGPERCALPKVKGPCTGKYTGWHFSGQTRRCEEFIYGGCLGNNNRFDTREACEQMCLLRASTDPCEQSLAVGPCRGSYPRWYFNREIGRCKQFLYGGCKGNDNNFESEAACKAQCPSSPYEICALPRAEGPCLGNFPRWYFDYVDGTCREFVYTGCEGNKNRFIDKANCEKTCGHTQIAAKVDVCSLPRSEGFCGANLIRWYYNTDAKRCERFYYGGCEGNANRFEDRLDCERACISQTREINICLQPKEPGNCFDYRERWYYDNDDKRCHRFYYSGCSGNDNNFRTFQECQQRCHKYVTPTEVVSHEFRTEFCFKPYDSGLCTNHEIRWFYDKHDGVCKEFYFGGCDGNENRFDSRNECETKCFNSQDICKLPKVRGPCSGKFTQFYYDHEADECLEFSFSGCHGNANRFNSKENCETQCRLRRPAVPQPEYAPVPTMAPVEELCRQAHDSGPCRNYLPRWYYDSPDNACKQFIYGGCDGNSNRFDSRRECEIRCVIKTPKPQEGPGDDDSNDVVCRQPVESGNCRETHARWFYDPQSYRCLPFVYGGCGGNKNRFKSYEVCMRFCSGISPAYAQPGPQPPTRPPTESREPDDIECPPADCEDQNCPLGVDEFVDERGCLSCRCSNPCYAHQCPADMSCAIEVFRSDRGEPRAQPVCRLRNKPGQCPTNVAPPSDQSIDCVDRCRTDADCRSNDKCCNNGCAQTCMVPEGVERGITPTIVRPSAETDAGGIEPSSTTPIPIEKSQVPECNDSPYFANCDLIVRAQYCNNPHYAKFCCRSCLLAGALDSNHLPHQ